MELLHAYLDRITAVGAQIDCGNLFKILYPQMFSKNVGWAYSCLSAAQDFSCWSAVEFQRAINRFTDPEILDDMDRVSALTCIFEIIGENAGLTNVYEQSNFFAAVQDLRSGYM